MRGRWSVVVLTCLGTTTGFGWGPVAVCEFDGLQLFPIVVWNQQIDNGAIVAWQDSRDGHCEVYTKGIRGDSGTTAPGWGMSGNPASSPPSEFTPYGHRLSCAATYGNAGEIITAWVNHHRLTVPGKMYRPGIYAQKMEDGSTQWSRWLGSEVGVEVDTGVTAPPTICSDGAGGCVIAVIESDRKTIKAWRLHSDGAFYTGNWGGSNGLTVRPPDVPGAGNKLVRNVKIVWGVDGAYVFWWDYRDHLWTKSPPRYVVRFYCIQVDSAGNKSGLTLLDTFDESYGQPLRPYAVCGGANCAYVTWADETYSGDCLNGKILASTLKCARVTGSGATSSVITGESYTPGLDRLLPHIEGLDIAFAQGNFCVVWAEKEGNFDVKASIRSGTDCSLVSTRQLSSASYDDRYPQVVAKDATEFIAVWQVIHSSTDIRYQWSKFTPTQQTLMDEFGQQGYANGNFDVAAVGSAGAIAAWSTGMGWDIWAKSLEW